jgi:ABC-type transport system involved in multi-copper enzyme maturation permease subunit
MSAFWAIVHDTWRQSKHQWVVILLLGAVGLYIPFAIFVPQVRQAPDGSEFVGTVFMKDNTQYGMETAWNGVYADALRDELGYADEIQKRSDELNELLDQFNDLDYEIKQREAGDPDSPELPVLRDRRREIEQARDRKTRERFDLTKYVNDEVKRVTDERTASISKMQKGVEYWLSEAVQFLFSVSLLIYLFICAGYVPNMIEAGSIDLVLSKPIRRSHIYFGKYFGGLLLYSMIMVIAYVLIFAGIGVKTGLWHWRFFGALPMTLFSAALLFAIIGWVGLWTRSTLMSAILGLVYYVIVDSAIGYLGDLGGTPFLADVPAIQLMADITKFIFPSFVWLKQSAVAAVLSVYLFPWKHVIVGVVWLVVCLGTSYNRFRINDY